MAIFFLSLPLLAQKNTRGNSTFEKYNYLDTNAYFAKQRFAVIADSLHKLQQLAKASGDDEFELSLSLFSIVKKYNETLISNDTAEYQLLKIISEVNGKNIRRFEADLLHVMGNFYTKEHQLNAAEEYYTLAYSIYKDLDNTSFPQKQQYEYEMALLLYQLRNYQATLDLLKNTLGLPRPNGKDLFGSIANTIGLAYRQLGQYDSANYYFKMVYDHSLAVHEPQWTAISQGNIGITYFLLKKYSEAEPLLKIDIENSRRNSNIRNAVESMSILATIYFEQRKYKESEALVLEALELSRTKHFWRVFSIAERLYRQAYEINRAQNRYSLAFLYADSAMQAKDSSAATNNATILANAYEKQNFIKKKLEREKRQNLARNEELKKLDQTQLLYKIIIGFLLVVLILATVLNQFRRKLKVMATNPDDAPDKVLQKMSIVIISIATCAAAVVWALMYYYYFGLRLATFGPVIYFLVIGPALIFYFLYKKEKILVNLQLFCIFAMPVMMELSNGGFKTGVVILWAFLSPVGALMYKGLRAAAYWMILFILAILVTTVFDDELAQYYYPISETAHYMFYCMDILGPSIVIYFGMQFFVKSIIRDGKLLQENNANLQLEKDKSDNLLLNILPAEVADELKINGKTTARHFDNVTVLFTDFVNFTIAGERMGPQELVDELHTCFKAFDEITGKYNIEKIKTVGDAYLAVAGLPTPDELHAEQVVRAAREIRAYMHTRLQELPNATFAIRIGVHSGSVVAGIVGAKKFAYDIWGDTVNTAARMEQNSEPGKINISATTFELVKDKFGCTYRGEIEAKGKGELKMYFVD